MTDLRVSALDKAFGELSVLSGIHLHVPDGSLTAVLGPSGSGKTTLLRIIAGFESLDRGVVEIGSAKVYGGGKELPPEKRRVGFVPQEGALFPHLSVADNVAFGMAHKARRSGRVEEMLKLTGMQDLGGRMPHELSSGQQQRVALARALAPSPSLILLDEPFSALDVGLKAKLREEVRSMLSEAGTTAILVTHDQEEALSLADEVAVMFDGRIVQTTPPEELYGSPATREVASFVGEANFLEGRARGGRVHCELGSLEAREGPEGEVEAMLRPESFGLRALEDGDSADYGGTVLYREFYGHDQLAMVRLDSGSVLQVRLGGGPGFKPGERVAVEVRGQAVLFPEG